MGHAIERFMWGYQPHFRITQECRAKALFWKLDRSFQPEVFLVGILNTPAAGYPACVEPEDDYWIPSTAFEHVRFLAEEIRPLYPESQLIHSHPIASKNQDGYLTRRSLRDAVLKVINQHPNKPQDKSYFASSPVQVDRYHVCVVLGLQTSTLDSHYSLSSDSIKIHPFRSIDLPRSLLHATIDEFLLEASRELFRRDPGAGAGPDRDTTELIRSAGSRLIKGIAYRVNVDDNEGPHTLFSSCNRLANMMYESVAGRGRIILARKDHPAVHRTVTFSRPTPLKRLRSTRKLLELSTNAFALHCNASHILGLGSVVVDSPVTEDIIAVR